MNCYLGLDSSTQGLKAEIIYLDSGGIIHSTNINFGKDLPEYHSPEGCLINKDPLVKHADPLMWAAALDLLFSRMQQEGAPLDEIKGICGSGQQHGSVYLNSSFPSILKNLDSKIKLPEQLAPALSRPTSPIWMDRSTAEECEEFQKEFGSRLQKVTGSPAIERFSGPQIRKFMKNEPDAYNNTKYIHLVSSFMASILCGQNAPVDYGDGAGMNLLNLKTLQWDEEIAEFTAPGLINKLPQAVPTGTRAGGLSKYYKKYGFQAGIPILTWSGDNPCSLIGTGAAEPGVAVISLGTSDTFFAAMRKFKTDPNGYGHVFGNPAGGFMSLICFTNGSLAREKIKAECDIDLEEFDRLAAIDSRQCGENLMLPYFDAESTPLILNPSVVYQGTPEFRSGKVSPEIKIRAILESQALTMKLHSEWMGEDFKRIRVTGGASNCRGFLQILANVFQADIEKIAIADSAGLGAALIAAHNVTQIPYSDLFAQFSTSTETIKPDCGKASYYEKALNKYAEMEKYFCKL